METIQQQEAERKENIKSEKYYRYFCIWQNKKGETKQKYSNFVDCLYYYEHKYSAVIYEDMKYDARVRLQKIIRA